MQIQVPVHLALIMTKDILKAYDADLYPVSERLVRNDVQIVLDAAELAGGAGAEPSNGFACITMTVQQAAYWMREARKARALLKA